jgi:hypothetical protein
LADVAWEAAAWVDSAAALADVAWEAAASVDSAAAAAAAGLRFMGLPRIV